MTHRRPAMGAVVAGVSLLSAGMLLNSSPWRWSWVRSAAGVLGDHAVLLAFGLPGLGLIAWSARGRPERHAVRSGSTSSQLRWPWLLSDRGVLAVAVAVAALGLASMSLMLRVAAGAAPADRPRLQIEALKYGLGFVAAAGAAVALLLAVRRQRLSEHTHDLELRKQGHTEADAAERQVTELYTKAVEQLGSEAAAVRLGGLHALERVAQNNPAQRQTVVDVICAYLRMPFAMPADEQRTGPEAPAAADATVPPDARQEIQVRATAQRILAAHLRMPEGLTRQQCEALEPDPRQSFWPGMDLDLTSAVLVDWRFERCLFRRARFRRAAFAAYADFGDSVFTREADFFQAAFASVAGFERVTFVDGATFAEVRVDSVAQFEKATFRKGAWFVYARFAGGANFSGAGFQGANFSFAAFGRSASYSGATFAKNVLFHATKFHQAPSFLGAAFTGDASFERAEFRGGGAHFSDATVALRDDRQDHWPPGWQVQPGEDGAPGRLVRRRQPG